jgi:hypothetical protein
MMLCATAYALFDVSIALSAEASCFARKKRVEDDEKATT